MSEWSKFEILTPTDPSSLIWASRGGDGSGKSFFGCTAPGPLWVAGFDPHGMQRVDKSIRSQREIRIGRYGFNHLKHEEDRKKVRDAATKIWESFVDDYHEALKHVRTVLWDREDLAWELRQYAAFGGQKNEGSKTGALDYGDLNAEYVALIQDAKDANVNLGLLQGLKDKWVAKYDPSSGKMKNYNTGELVPDGFKKIADHVDVTLDHHWDTKAKEYVTTLRKFPIKAEKDKEYPNLDFFLMASLAFPEADSALWMTEA